MPWLASSRASIVEAPVFVLVFLWLSAALGRKIQRWLGVPQAGADAERALTALALGAGALQVLPFALGAMGQLGVSSARLAMLVSAIVLFPEMRRVLAEAARAIGRRRRPTWTLAWTLALLPGLITAALWALAPTTDTDGLWYHLTVPKRWLASGSLGYLPTYPNSNMPMGVEMLFTLALSAVGDSGAKLLHFALGVCGAIGLYLTGARLRTPTAGAAAVALYLFGPLGVAELLGWAFLEGATTFATIGATLAWVTWYREREQGWLRCAFLLAGIGLSFKMTTGLLPLALAGLTGVVEVDRARARSLRTATARLWGPLALCLAPVAPWLGRAAIVTGNPFFPLLAGHIPSRDFSPTLATEWAYFNRYLNWAIIIGRDWTIERRQTILLGCGFVIMVVAGVACAVLRS